MNISEEEMQVAKKHLEYAASVQQEGDFEWACLAAHHAAEKVLKTILTAFGKQPRGHSLTNLCHLLSMQITLVPGILDSAKRLDNFFARSKQLEGGVDDYSEEDAKRALLDANGIGRFCERL